MATTLTFTSAGTASFTSSVAVTIACYGAGGHGSPTGNGGSGGGYASTTKTFTGSLLVTVGQPTATDGGDSYVTSASVIICRAPGGKMDGTVTHQTALLTGSVAVYYGGQGSPDFAGYANYNGSGGGSSGASTGNGADGASAFFATRRAGAPGGAPAANAGAGGDGAFYYADAGVNSVWPAGAGSQPGGGGGGSFDYGQNSSGAGAIGAVTITF
jgi:hypothetical protein